MENEWFQSKWASVVPFLTLAIFFGIYVLLQLSFVECKIGRADCRSINPIYVFSVAPEPLDDAGNFITENKDDKKSDTNSRKTLIGRYNGRMLAMFMLAANALFDVIGIVILFSFIRKMLGFKVAAASIIVSFLMSFVLGFNDPMPLMKPILANTIDTLAGGLPGIVGIVKAVNSIAYVATLAVVIAISAILYSDGRNKDEIADETAAKTRLREISGKKEDLGTVLYIGTLLLVIGVLRQDTVSSWTLTFMTAETAEIAKTYFTHLTAVIGGFFTIMLAVIYLPAIYILQQRGKKVLEDFPALEPEPAEKFTKANFTFSLAESLPRVLAIAAPFLTGPIAELVKKLT